VYLYSALSWTHL